MAQAFPQKFGPLPHVVTYKTGKHSFEVPVDEKLLDQYRLSSNRAGLTSLLQSNDIYTNFHKGQIASSEELKSVFDLKSVEEIQDIIVRQGQHNASVADKREHSANHRSAVIQYVHDNYINTQTKLPVEIDDLNKAVEQHKIKIGDGAVETVAAHVIHSLLGTYTLKQGLVVGDVEITADLAPAAMGIFHKYSQVEADAQAWFGDELKYVIHLKPGDYGAFRSALDKLTKGKYKFNLKDYKLTSIEDSDISTPNAHSIHSTKEERREVDAEIALAKQLQKQEKKQNREADVNRLRKESAGVED